MRGILAVIFDPLVFNKILLLLYIVNALQFFSRKMWADAFYWTGAAIITGAVTWGFKRS